MKPNYYVIDFYTGNTAGTYNNYEVASQEAERLTRDMEKKYVVAKSVCLFKPAEVVKEHYDEF